MGILLKELKIQNIYLVKTHNHGGLRYGARFYGERRRHAMRAGRKK